MPDERHNASSDTKQGATPAAGAGSRQPPARRRGRARGRRWPRILAIPVQSYPTDPEAHQNSQRCRHLATSLPPPTSTDAAAVARIPTTRRASSGSATGGRPATFTDSGITWSGLMPRDGFPRTPLPSPTAPRTACHGGRTPTATVTSAFVGRGREPSGTTASTVTAGDHAEKNEARAVEGVAAAVDHHNSQQGRASHADDGLTRPWAKPLGRAAGAHSRHSQRGAPARGRFRRGANATPPAPLASHGSQTTRPHCRSSPPPRPPPQAPTGRNRRALPAPRNWRRGVALGREGGASMAPRRRPHPYPPLVAAPSYSPRPGRDRRRDCGDRHRR